MHVHVIGSMWTRVIGNVREMVSLVLGFPDCFNVLEKTTRVMSLMLCYVHLSLKPQIAPSCVGARKCFNAIAAVLLYMYYLNVTIVSGYKFFSGYRR